MATKVQAQLAAIRKEAHRIELEKMRQHVKTKRGSLRAKESDERLWTKARKDERRERLRGLRRAISTLSHATMTERRERLRVIHEKRKLFTDWWARVRAERSARLTEISRLRQELRDWSKLGPERRKESVAQITAAATRELAAFDAETRDGLNALEMAIAKARADLKSDEYDLRTWAANRKHDTKSPRTRVKKPRGESRSELISNVELNLETPEEWAWWRHGRRVILEDAKQLGLTDGDQIAELVRERVEADPERAVEYLQNDADAWVAAELRKAGFAA